MSPEEIHSALLQNVSSIKTFSASGTISVESPSIAQSVGFELSSRGLDSIRIILEGPFGITAGAGLFSRATFKVYNALNNTIYQGSSQKQLAGFPIISNIPVDVIISAMNGMQYIPSFAEPDSFAMNEGMYRLVFVRDDGSKDVYGFDASSQRIQRYDHFDAEGNLLWKLRYRYTKDENSQWIPETVGIIIPSKEIMLTIEYSEAKYNIAVPDYSIETPNDAETVTIE